MNPTERILAALHHSEAAPAAEAAPPPKPAEEPQTALGVLAATDTARIAPPLATAAAVLPVPHVVPPVEEYPGVRELAAVEQPKGRGRRRILLAIGALVAVLGAAAFLLRDRWSGQPAVAAPAPVVVTNPPPAATPPPATPAVDTAAEVPMVVNVTAHAEPTAPARAFTPPEPAAAPVSAEPRPVLAEPSLPLDSMSSSTPPAQLPVAMNSLPAAAPPPPVKQAPPHPAVRIGGDLQPLQLIKRVEPLYPEVARMSHIEGRVRFTATVGKDGAVHGLQKVSGPLMLAGAAERAVKQWVYRPAMLNGKPVESATDVEISFSLTRQ